jgi:competence ComEA-like helix-hairpin-helix protein
MQGNLKFGSCGSGLRIPSVAGAIALFICLGTAIAQKNLPTQPVNINTATIEQLEKLPGIGPNTAKSIVQFRERSGPFQRIEDLLAIKGISKARLEKLRPYVTVGPAVPNRHSAGPHQAFVKPVFSSPNFQEPV